MDAVLPILFELDSDELARGWVNWSPDASWAIFSVWLAVAIPVARVALVLIVEDLQRWTFDDATLLSAREDRCPDRDAPAWRYDHSRIDVELIGQCLQQLDEAAWDEASATPGYRDDTVLTVPLRKDGQHLFDVLISEHLIAVAAAEVECEPIASYFITPYEVHRAEARAVSDS